MQVFCDRVDYTGLAFHRSAGGPATSGNPETMTLKRSEVEKIAHLARLQVSDDELDAVAGDLSNILDLVAQMEGADTEGVTPMAHPLHMAQRLRPDEVTEGDQRDKFQAIAPATENGLYLVPKVID